MIFFLNMSNYINESGLKHYLEYVEHQTPEICLAAVKQSRPMLEFIANKNIKIVMYAILQNAKNLQYILQNKYLQIIAIRQNPNVYQYSKPRPGTVLLKIE
jgi:diketogulonate reductase-like aldo/keto reductase